MSTRILKFSPKNSDPSVTLLHMPFKMLPIVSLEDWRLRRIRTQIERIARTRPIAFAVIERWVDHLDATREDGRAHAR